MNIRCKMSSCFNENCKVPSAVIVTPFFISFFQFLLRFCILSLHVLISHLSTVYTTLEPAEKHSAFQRLKTLHHTWKCDWNAARHLVSAIGTKLNRAKLRWFFVFHDCRKKKLNAGLSVSRVIRLQFHPSVPSINIIEVWREAEGPASTAPHLRTPSSLPPSVSHGCRLPDVSVKNLHRVRGGSSSANTDRARPSGWRTCVHVHSICRENTRTQTCAHCVMWEH